MNSVRLRISFGCRFQLRKRALVGSLFLAAAVAQLVHEDRGHPLREKQKSEARCHDRIGLGGRRSDETTVLPRLAIDEISRSLAIPVMRPEETMGGEPSRAFDTVEEVQGPHSSLLARIDSDREMPPKPFDAAAQGAIGVRRPVAAFGRAVRIQIVFARVEHLFADLQRPDAGAGHAAGAGLADMISPPAVPILGLDEVGLRQFPSPAVDGDFCHGRLAQRQQGELRVAVVFRSQAAAVVPHPNVIAAEDLETFEPAGQALNPQEVPIRLLGGRQRHEHHGALISLKTALRFVRRSQKSQPLCDDRIIGGHS